MRINEELTEKPDCGHYGVCAERMTEIKRFTKVLLLYTSITGLFNIMLAMNGFRLGALGAIPAIFFEIGSAGFIFAQIAEVVLLILLSAWGYKSNKISLVFLSVIYLILVIMGVMEGLKGLDSIPFAYCFIGFLLSFRSYNFYCDYKQLSETEGFPYFNHLFEKSESNEYQPQYINEYKKLPKAADRNLSRDDETAGLAASDMPDLPDVTSDDMMKKKSYDDNGMMESIMPDIPLKPISADGDE